jgi:serine protease Do
VNRKATPSASAVKDALASVSNGDSVMLRVWSNGGSTFRVLHPSNG